MRSEGRERTVAADRRSERRARVDLLLLGTALVAGPDGAIDRARSVDADLADRLAERSGLASRGGGSEALRRALDRMRAADRTALRADHAARFEGASDTPPNETAYIRRDKGAILADLCGFYRAFGMIPSDEKGEKADHFATELQFAALLVLMEEEAANDDERSVARDALGAFVADHPGDWIPMFTARLEERARTEALRAAARFLSIAWAVFLEAEGIPLEPPDPAGVPPDLRPGTPYECGLCPLAGKVSAAPWGRTLRPGAE